MPISAFEEELPGSSITLHNLSHNTSAQILKVVAYAISNNFPGHSNRTEIHRSLRSLGTFSPEIIQLLQDSSNQALLQGLLRLAVEEGDVQLASTLLDAGADPNDNACVHGTCPIPLTPLQYSCLNGNLELVKELLRAKAQIDQPEFGWSCSPLLFAIYGCFELRWTQFAEETTIEAVETAACDVSDSSDDESDDESDDADGSEEGHRVETLLTLIQQLLNAGADVNAVAEDLDDLEYSMKEWRKQANPNSEWYSLIYEKHSALTLGSSFRCPELVDLLIRNGAEIGFHLDGARSALRECLYTSAERFKAATSKSGRPLIVGHRFFWILQGPTGVSKLQETAKMLIMAGVAVNDHDTCHYYGSGCEVHDDLECYSAFDLGILSQDRDLINALWYAGARPTGHSFGLAIEAWDYDTFCQVLGSEAVFPEWALIGDERRGTEDEPWYLESRKATECQKRRAMILAAIQLGRCDSLENLTRLYDSSNLVGDCDALQEAIEKCCARGYQNTLVCLLRSNIVPQNSLASILGSSIVLAIAGDHPEMVNVLLMAGADVNATHIDYPGVTPLQLAIEGGNKELVRRLVHHGAKAESPERGNLLIEAIHGGDHDIIQLLLAHASPDRLGRSKERFFSPMGSPLAAVILEEQWAIFDQLLQLGASVSPGSQHARPLQYHTPLWAAVRRNNITLAEWLLKNGAEANDELALEAAAEDEDSVLLRMLVEKLQTEVRRGERNALHMALWTAMNRGHWNNFRLILQNNIIDVPALSESIHRALKSDVTHRDEFVQSLIDAGACADIITGDDHRGSRTPLLTAISQRDLESVKIILERRPGTNEALAPETPYSHLQLAAILGNVEIVRLLLDNGQDPDVVSCATPCGWFPEARDFEYHPIGNSVQIATVDKAYEILKALLQHGANPDSTTKQCPHSALQIACRDGSMELVELLLEYGANVDMPPARQFGATALQFAAIGGYVGIAHLLLEKGADVNAEAAEIEGRTALEGAAEHGRIDMVQLLRNAGADISESGGGQFKRALRRARRNGHSATAKRLESFLS